MIELKDDIDFCDEIDVNFFNGLCSVSIKALYLANFLILKVIFLLLSGFAGRDIK